MWSSHSHAMCRGFCCLVPVVGNPPPLAYIIIIIDFLKKPRADGVWGLPQRPSGSVYEATLVYAAGATARWYAIAATTCPGTTLDRMDRRSLCQRGDGGCINNASVNREGMIQTSSVSSVSDAGSWPRSSSSWTRSCVRPRSCIASGFSTSSSSSSRWLGDRRILPPPSSSLSE